MKKINKVLMVVLLGVVGLSSGMAKAEEGDSEGVCEKYTDWCGDWADLSYCNPTFPCYLSSIDVVTCMQWKGTCQWPDSHSDYCEAKLLDHQSCMQENPICGDGFVSGDEECDAGLNGNATLPRHDGVMCGNDCKLHKDCEFKEEGCPQDSGGHEGH